MKIKNQRYSKKSIVIQTENFGFGPTSLALAILDKLVKKGVEDYEIVFMGNGVALQLAKLSNLFNRYVNIDTTDNELMTEKSYLLGDVQLFISVVSPSGAIFAKEQGYKVCCVEPLLWFFDCMDKRLEDVDYFVVQKFGNTQKELDRLNFHPKNLIEVGWITSEMKEKNVLKSYINKFCKTSKEQEYFKKFLTNNNNKYVLINFGGVDNMLAKESIYPKVICDIIVPIIKEVKKGYDIIAIGGGNKLQNLQNEYEDQIGDDIWIGAVPQEWAQFLIKNAEDYFLSCGLSSLIEMCIYRENAFGLPAQNYSQHMQIKRFRKLLDKWNSFDYYDYDEKYVINDFIPEIEGVGIVNQSFEEFHNSEEFMNYFKSKISEYLTTEESNKKFAVNSTWSLDSKDGAAVIADILFKDLYLSNSKKYMLSEKEDNNSNLFRMMYKNSIEELSDSIKQYSSILPSRYEDNGLENALNQIWILNNRNENKKIPNKIDVVTGGPCICYCEGDENKLSLQDIMDITYPILAASLWNSKVAFVLTSYESNMQITNDQILKNKYDQLGQKIKNYVYKIADDFNLDRKNIFFIDTSDSKIVDIITEEADMYIENNDINNLHDLYYFKSLKYGKAPKKEDVFLKVFARSIIMYTANFISRCINEDVKSLAVVENTTQLKAVQKGFGFSKDCGFKGFMGHYTYLPMPATNGLEMVHAEPEFGIYLNDSIEDISDKLNNSLKSYVAGYYMNIWPRMFSNKYFNCNITLPEQISAFLSRVKEYMNSDIK